ncbi:MAG TPA: LCP family protein [Thermoflexia bacterium]|nr:LCP family protein [Thermoflexia bacterium]
MLKMRPKHFRLLVRGGLVLSYLLILLLANLVTFTRIRELAARSEMLPIFTTRDKGPSINVEYEEGEPLPSWTGTERLSILLLGIDERAQWDEEAWRTDTMIVLTLDPVTLQAGVLSIPRDIWVEIPGYQSNRINTAHYIGQVDDYPGGGPALAVETVEQNLGIELDHYVRVNFQAFINIVNEIGGIDIYVEETIDDPFYPDTRHGYDPLYIEAGQHNFEGEIALKYARTRHSGQGDFDRARRQQQVILAILDKAMQPAVLSKLLTRAPELYAMVESSIDTDFKLDQLIALAGLASQIDRDEIRFAVVDESCTENWTTPDDAQVLVPIRERMRQKRDYIFGIGPEPGAASDSEEQTATLSILNGTLTPGLAGATGEYLRQHDVEVTNYANADRQDYAESIIILNRAKPALAQRLVELLGVPPSAIVNGDNPTAEYDIIVILGQDYAEWVSSKQSGN